MNGVSEYDGILGTEMYSNLRDMAEHAFDKLNKYFNVSSDFFMLAIVLDPRMKLTFYEDRDKSPTWNIEEKLKIKDTFKGIESFLLTHTRILREKLSKLSHY